MELRDEIRELAARLGFAAFGVAAATPLSEEAAHLNRWLEDGFHGSMGWMETTAEVRADVNHPGMLPDAKSVVVLATPYARHPAIRGGARIARYAQGRDYHTVLGKRLRKITRLLRERGFAARASVDSLPVFERAWAERAGVGFVGKNCCLIIPGLGSHVFLSTVVTSARLPPDKPMGRRCGDCRLCLDACPTGAFLRERRLDSRRCISYLTIEHREGIEPDLEGDIGAWLFGCDACQDVCPYNQGQQAAPEDDDPFRPRSSLGSLNPEDWLAMDETTFEQHTVGSPLRRPGLDALARNAAVVLGNGGVRRHLPVLQHAASAHRSRMVREAAQRALIRLERRFSDA